jgi:hypothetical protein
VIAIRENYYLKALQTKKSICENPGYLLFYSKDLLFDPVKFSIDKQPKNFI